MRKISNQSGFTLVELMVVVAIIGILAAIAIPNYQKYQAKAKQTEAKIALAAIKTAESSFAVENSTFTGCISDAGFLPSGYATAVQSNRSYYVGMTLAATNGATCGVTAACSGITYSGGVPTNNCTATTPTHLTATAPTTPTVGNHNEFASSVVAFNPAAVTWPTEADLTAAPISAAVGTSTFTIGAAGQISTANNLRDLWTINQDGVLSNVQSAL